MSPWPVDVDHPQTATNREAMLEENKKARWAKREDG
jgi:hypothetical protein